MKKKPSSRSAFTLVEIMVSITVLFFLMLILGQMIQATASLLIYHGKSMDADEQARVLFDRMSVDFSGMTKRTDVNYFLKSSIAEATYPQNNDLVNANPLSGNDQLAFYSEVSGYSSSTEAVSSLSLVAYRLNTTSLQMERMGKGLSWNGAAATGSGDQFVSLPLTLGSKWPTAVNSSPDTSYETIGPPAFRFEYYYLLKKGLLSATPWDTSSGHTSLDGLHDVAAIIVTVAVIDSKTRKIVPDATLAGLALKMNDFSDTAPTPMKSGDLVTQWQGVLQGAGLPPLGLSGLHIYQRYFYLNTF